MGKHGHDRVEYDKDRDKEKKKEDDHKLNFASFEGMDAKAIKKELKKNPDSLHDAVANIILSLNGVVETAHKDKKRKGH